MQLSAHAGPAMCQSWDGMNTLICICASSDIPQFKAMPGNMMLRQHRTVLLCVLLCVVVYCIVEVCCRLPTKLCCLWWLWGARPQQCVSSWLVSACTQPSFIISSIWSSLHLASIWPIIQHACAESAPQSITICPILHVSVTTRPGTCLNRPCLWLSS